MRKNLSLFAADADQWEADGMPVTDEDALVLALWRWYRGRPQTDGLSLVAKVLYSTITKRLEASESLYEARSRGGKIGMAKRWSNKSVGKSVITQPITDREYPTATSTATATPNTSSSTASTSSKKNVTVSSRFVKPTEAEVRAYCDEQGFTDVDAEQFVDHYTANGWVVGKARAPMKDWKASVRTWHRNTIGKSAKAETPFTQEGYQLRLGKESK